MEARQRIQGGPRQELRQVSGPKRESGSERAARTERGLGAPASERVGESAGAEPLGAKERCAWCGEDPLYVAYHDEEWGVPVHDDRHLFEMLNLEGAQAGLSWITILRKRDAYRRAFDRFDAAKIARYDKKKILSLLADPG